MYAVIAHGGKQYRVSPGQVVRLESFDAKPGSTVELGDVRLYSADDGVQFGSSTADKKVIATVIGRTRGPKVIVFKKKRRKQYRRTAGHRQNYVEVRVNRIE